MVRSLLDGRDSQFSSVKRIADALGLECYVGPVRAGLADEKAMLETWRAQQSEMNVWKEGLIEVLSEAVRHTVDEGLGQLPQRQEAQGFPGLIPMYDVNAAAGGGALNEEEKVVSHLGFRRDWLHKRGLNPGALAVIQVQGDSMEPVLTDGASILIDRSCKRRKNGGIFVVRTPDGLLLKRLAKAKRTGSWLLVSDNPDYEPLPWPEEAELIGQAVWTARALSE